MDAKEWVAALKKSGKPGPLLATLREGKQVDIATRLHALDDYADDLAVGDAVLEIALAPPWTSDSSKPLWTQVFALAAKSNDPRLKEAKPEWAVRPLFKTWLTNGWKRAVAELPSRDALTPARRKQLEAHEKAAPVKKPVGEKGTTDDSLLAAIYGAPADDAPRRVYADVLMEKGDPRGEFISLQLANADVKKQKALLKAHGKQWLGELSEVVGAGFEFRRGFLAKATLKFRNQADFEKWGARPEWATLEEVDFAGRGTVPDGQAQFIYAITPAMKALRHARLVCRPAIVDVQQPWALETLSVELENEELRALFESKMFPRLHTLELSKGRNVEAAFFKSLQRVGAVKHFIGFSRLPGPTIEAASRLPFETVTLNQVVYTRDAKGQLSNASVQTAAATDGFPAFGWIDAMRALSDGSLVVVTDEEIWHVDSTGRRVLNRTSRNLTAWKARWLSTSFTSDGRVIGACFKTVTITDPVSGEVTVISAPGFKSDDKRLSPLSDDERYLSATGRHVVDLQKRTELKPPTGAGKAAFISPDQQWWVVYGPLGEGRFEWVLQRAGSREKHALEEAHYLHRLSAAAGRLFIETDDGLSAWDVATAQRLASAKGVSLHSFEAGGALLTAFDGGMLRLRDAATLAVRGSWGARAATVTPDGKTVWVAEVNDQQLRLVAHPLARSIV